jgi:hypothetical protein
MFYLIYGMFLFTEHIDLLIATRAYSWGAARPGAPLDSGAIHGWRGGGSGGGGGSHGVGGSCGVGC